MKLVFLFTTILFASLSTAAHTAEQIRMAVTTSFHNSGLADILLPQIAADLDLDVQLLVVGTGQALRLGRAGDVDAILVHSRSAEEAFVADGAGTHRREIMYNDFVVVGPTEDPAEVATAKTATEALQKIAGMEIPFVSRGDDSGTHKMELALWQSAGLDVARFDRWYRAVGAGMGAALTAATGMHAYILTDRASWLNYNNKQGLTQLFAGDPILFNQYAFLPVNPERHPHVRADLVAQLEGWLTSDTAAKLINAYQIKGESLFVFNAKPR